MPGADEHDESEPTPHPNQNNTHKNRGYQKGQQTKNYLLPREESKGL